MEDFHAAEADPVSVQSRTLLARFNIPQYLSAFPSLCKEYANEAVKEPILYHIDRFGFNILATSLQVRNSTHYKTHLTN